MTRSRGTNRDQRGSRSAAGDVGSEGTRAAVSPYGSGITLDTGPNNNAIQRTPAPAKEESESPETDGIYDPLAPLRTGIPFRTRDGELHHIYLQNDVLMLASDPQTLQAALDKADLLFDQQRLDQSIPRDDIMAAFRNARNALLTAESQIKKRSKTLKAEKKKGPVDPDREAELEREKDAYRALREPAKALMDYVAGIDEMNPSEATGLPETPTPDYTPGPAGWGRKMSVAPLTVVGPKGSSPSEVSDNWNTLALRKGESGKATYYIRGHLLNDNTHGPGKMFNMTPLTRKANHEHSDEVEEKVKAAVFAGQTMRYEVEARNKLGQNPAYNPHDPDPVRQSIMAAETEAVYTKLRCTVEIYDHANDRYVPFGNVAPNPYTVDNSIHLQPDQYNTSGQVMKPKLTHVNMKVPYPPNITNPEEQKKVGLVAYQELTGIGISKAKAFWANRHKFTDWDSIASATKGVSAATMKKVKDQGLASESGVTTWSPALTPEVAPPIPMDTTDGPEPQDVETVETVDPNPVASKLTEYVDYIEPIHDVLDQGAPNFRNSLLAVFSVDSSEWDANICGVYQEQILIIAGLLVQVNEHESMPFMLACEIFEEWLGNEIPDLIQHIQSTIANPEQWLPVIFGALRNASCLSAGFFEYVNEEDDAHEHFAPEYYELPPEEPEYAEVITEEMDDLSLQFVPHHLIQEAFRRSFPRDTELVGVLLSVAPPGWPAILSQVKGEAVGTAASILMQAGQDPDTAWILADNSFEPFARQELSTICDWLSGSNEEMYVALALVLQALDWDRPFAVLQPEYDGQFGEDRMLEDY